MQSTLSLKRLLACGGQARMSQLNPHHHLLENSEVISQIPFFEAFFFSHFSISPSPRWSLEIVVSMRWSLTKQWLLAWVSVACVGFPGFLLYLIAHHICDKWRQKPQWREVQRSMIYWLQRNSWPYLWETFYETWPRGNGEWLNQVLAQSLARVIY